MHQTLVGMGSSMILSVMLVFLLMVALYNSYRLAVHHHVLGAGRGDRRDRRARTDAPNAQSVLADRHDLADRHRDQERHPAGGLCQHAARARLDKLTAIKESAYTRFRPIIMTSFSVIAGNIPLALALEPGSSSRSSLGIVVIGGVTQLAAS